MVARLHHTCYGQALRHFVQQDRDKHENPDRRLGLCRRADRHAIEKSMDGQPADGAHHRGAGEYHFVMRLLAKVHVAGEDVLEEMNGAEADKHREESEFIPFRKKKTLRDEFEENEREQESRAEREQRVLPLSRPVRIRKHEQPSAHLRERGNQGKTYSEQHGDGCIPGKVTTLQRPCDQSAIQDRGKHARIRFTRLAIGHGKIRIKARRELAECG